MVTIDKSSANTAALATLNAEKPDDEAMTVRQSKYLNNLKLNESDLSNVFLKRTQATITANNDVLVMLILEQSREAGIIRSFERRDEGKIEVSIIRDRDQEE